MLAKAHTRFGFAWNQNGEEAVLLSRCADEGGWVTTRSSELGKIWDVVCGLLFWEKFDR